MAKIGPNEPCPCGSGKKFKKCCFIKDGRVSRPVQSPALAPRRPAPVAPKSFDEMAAQYGLPAYTIARRVEEEFYEAPRLPKARPALSTDIAALSTERLLARLADLGVHITEPEYVAAARGQRSAWELSRRWRAHIAAERKWEHDFVALAVCELWERWCPEPPSVEMVDDWMQDGYTRLEDGEQAEPYEAWLRAWQVLREWIRPEMRTIQAAEDVFRGSQPLFNWLQDFAMYADNAARASPSVGKRAVAAIRECLERFPDEKPGILRSLRTDLARVHFALGERDEARTILEWLIAAEPKACGPYAVLSDELAFHPKTPDDVQEALQVLLRAKEAKVTDGSDYDLEARIENVRERLRTAAEAPPTTNGEAR